MGIAMATLTGGATIAAGVGAAIACCGAARCAATGATSAEGIGLAGRTTELVVSDDGDACAMRSPSPELEVQPAKAMLARPIADAAEKRIVTRTQN